MARWKFTRGQKTSELLEHNFFDLRKLPVQHLKEIVSRIAATANKRLKRLSDTGIHGPAYEQAMTAGKFGVGGKTQEQLISEFERAKQFMQNPTSTTAGVIKTYTETVKEAYEASGREIDEEEILGDTTPTEIKHFGQYVHQAEDLGIGLHVNYEIYIRFIKRIVAKATKEGRSHEWMQARIISWTNQIKQAANGRYNGKFDSVSTTTIK